MLTFWGQISKPERAHFGVSNSAVKCSKEPIRVKVPIRLSDGSVSSGTFPVHLPFDVLQYLICDCNLNIDAGLLDQYWSHLDNVGDEWASSTKEYRRTAGVVWPLGFYGDEAAIGLINAPTNKVYGLFMNVVVFRPASTRMGRFLLFSIESDKVVSAEKTMFPVVDVITASFNKLTEEGIKHIRFLLSEIRGDQVFFRYLFQHRLWWKHTEVCFRCQADSKCGRFNYCIYDSHDGWRTSLRSTEEFLVDQLPRNGPECFLDELISDVFFWYILCGCGNSFFNLCINQ